jgi:hypothetical protein
LISDRTRGKLSIHLRIRLLFYTGTYAKRLGITHTANSRVTHVSESAGYVPRIAQQDDGGDHPTDPGRYTFSSRVQGEPVRPTAKGIVHDLSTLALLVSEVMSDLCMSSCIPANIPQPLTLYWGISGSTSLFGPPQRERQQRRSASTCFLLLRGRRWILPSSQGLLSVSGSRRKQTCQSQVVQSSRGPRRCGGWDSFHAA